MRSSTVPWKRDPGALDKSATYQHWRLLAAFGLGYFFAGIENSIQIVYRTGNVREVFSANCTCSFSQRSRVRLESVAESESVRVHRQTAMLLSMQVQVLKRSPLTKYKLRFTATSPQCYCYRCRPVPGKCPGQTQPPRHPSPFTPASPAGRSPTTAGTLDCCWRSRLRRNRKPHRRHHPRWFSLLPAPCPEYRKRFWSA